MQVGDKVLVDPAMLEHAWYPCDEFVANSIIVKDKGHRTVTKSSTSHPDFRFHTIELDSRPFLYHPTSVRSI